MQDNSQNNSQDKSSELNFLPKEQQLVGKEIIDLLVSEYESFLRKYKERLASLDKAYESSAPSLENLFNRQTDGIMLASAGIVEFAEKAEDKLTKTVTLKGDKRDVSEVLKNLPEETLQQHAKDFTKVKHKDQVFKPLVNMFRRMLKFQTEDFTFDREAFNVALQKDSKLQDLIGTIVLIVTLGLYETEHRAAKKIKSFAAKVSETKASDASQMGIK